MSTYVRIECQNLSRVLGSHLSSVVKSKKKVQQHFFYFTEKKSILVGNIQNYRFFMYTVFFVLL